MHSSVDSHWNWFHILAVVNSAAVNTGLHVCFQIVVFSKYIPRNGIADSYNTLFFSFLKNSILLSMVDAQIYISTNNIGWFLFPHTLSSIYHL